MRSATAVVEVELRPELYFTGPPNAATTIQVYGLLGSVLSFENIATQISAQLIQDFAAVALHDYRHREPDTQGPFPEHRFVTRDAPIAVYHGVAYKELRTELAQHRFKIGCFVCDADRLRPTEVAVCNFFDLVVVPSAFCRDVFKKNGVTSPILIVPHGVGEQFVPAPCSDRPDRFTFYNVYDQRRAYRKSQEELMRSFVRAFDRDPAYHLRLRTESSPTLQELLQQERAQDVVTVDTDPLADTVYAQRFSEVHAVVHPSKAEGFGMIPLQSLACATPVIAPAITGLKDYLSKDNAMILRTEGQVPALGETVADLGGKFHGIDEAHLVQCLQAMAEDWAMQQQKAALAGPELRQKYSWERVTAPLRDIIRQQLERPGSEIRVPA